MLHTLNISAINDIRIGRMFSCEELGSAEFTSFCSDVAGFMWIGTDNGLFRFDGNHYYPYRHNESDTSSISDNRILGILMDRGNRIWVATANGLNLYEAETNSFQRIPVKDFGENGYIISMTANDSSGVTFVVSGVGIFNIVERPDGKLSADEIYSSEELDHVNSILRHSNGRLYAGTALGDVYRIGVGIKPQKIAGIGSGVGEMVEELDGSVLVDAGKGLFRLNVNSGTVGKIKLREDIKINSLSRADGDRVYIATFGSGVWKVRMDSDKAEYCSDLYSSAIDIHDAKVGAVYGASDGSLWIGCDYYGVLMFAPDSMPFLYRKISSISSEFSIPVSSMDVWNGNTVICNHEGKIIVVSEDGSLNKEISIPGGGPVQSIKVIENDKALLGIQGSGVWEVDLLDGKAVKILDIPGKYLSTVISVGNDGYLYVGVYGIGLLRYDWKSGEKTLVSRDSNGKDIIPPFFTSIIPQGDLLWIGLYGGFACYNAASGKFREIDQSPFVSGATYAVAPENNRSVLVGTSNGLIRYDPETDKSTRLTTNEGLADNDVRSIIIDRVGGKWIGTMRGLTHIDKDYNDMTSYSGGHGMEESTFERMCYSKESNKIYASGRLGITSFHPDSLALPEFKSPIGIAAIYLKGEELSHASMIDGVRVIEGRGTSPEVLTLPFNENSVVLRLSAMDFRDTSNMNYLWRMNENEDWKELPKGTDIIHLPSLRPGSYKLEFKANEAGRESPVSSVRIKVANPWYFTWLAKIIYLSVIIALLWMAVVVVRKRHMERVNERKMQFFMDMSHDMRSPLTMIIGPIDSLLKESLSPDIRNRIRAIYRNAHRILNLVNQLLDLKRMDYGKKSLMCRPTFLPQFIEEIVDMFRFQASEKEITIDFEEGNEVSEVWIDRAVIDRILVNLISNAIKYTPEKGRIEIMLRSTVDQKVGDCVVISIMDTGIGLGSGGTRELFNPFHRLDNGKSYTDGGYGLGLDICRRYALLHHGEVRGENRKDGVGGSVFSVLIPTDKSKYASGELADIKELTDNEEDEYSRSKGLIQNVSYESETGKRKTGLNKECKVLVVEDDRELREALCEYLSSFFKVFSAEDGNEGYRMAQEMNPDVLITDVVMPNVDGLQLLRKLKGNTDTMHIPVVILSSKTDVADRLAGWRIGAEGYLGKPFDFNELRVIVNNLIEGRSILKGKYTGAVSNDNKLETDSYGGRWKNDSLLDKVTKILSDKIEEDDMNVSRLSHEVGLSRSQLYRRMKEQYGMTPSDLIRNLRLKRACELLKNANLDITQIAYISGFSSQSQFSTTFKRFIGYTPSEYRMKHTAESGS